MLDHPRVGTASAPGPEVFTGRATYRVVRPLGAGGFGITHLARRDGDGREVVVKQLRLDRMGDWKAFDLFEREAAVLEALRHPSIPAFIDHFEVKDARGFTGFALVQEYVPGSTLSEMMARRPAPTASVMRGWLERLLEILAYLHERTPPVIHRDISPKNVIVRSNGEPVLIDFGTVQHALRSASTVASTAAGTFGYAAPEQLLGRALPCSDVYGLAMTYLAVATGREPETLAFRGNRVDVSAALGEHDTHPRLALLLEELTDPDPDRRPGSARDVLARLRAIPTTRATPGPAAIAFAPEESPEAQIERQWRARADRALRVGRAGALRPPSVPATEDLRGCTIEAGGRAVLTEIGFKEGLVGSLDLDTYALTPWGTHDFPDLFHADVTFDEDGRSALLVCFDKGGLVTIDGTGARVKRSVRDLPDRMMSKMHDRGAYAVSPDHELLACLDRAEIVMLDLERGGVVQRVALKDSFAGFAGRMRFAPDGAAILLEVTSATWIVDAKGDIERFESTRFATAEDGRSVAMATKDELVLGTIERFAPLGWREPPRRVCKLDAQPEHLRFSPDGRMIAFEQGDRVRVVDLQTGRVRLVAGDPYRPGAALARIRQVGFSADGRRLLVSGRLTLHPLASERDEALAVYSITRGEPLGSIRLQEDGTGAYGFTTLGVHGPLRAASKGKADATRALLLDEDPADVLGDELDAALEFRDRAAFWGAQVGAGRLPEGQALGPLIEASAGLGHLLPVAVARAEDAVASAPARFGAVSGAGGAPSASALGDALAWLAGKGEAEREVLFSDMLAKVVTEEAARRAEAAGEDAGPSRGRAWAWLLVAAVVLALSTWAFAS